MLTPCNTSVTGSRSVCGGGVNVSVIFPTPRIVRSFASIQQMCRTAFSSDISRNLHRSKTNKHALFSNDLASMGCNAGNVLGGLANEILTGRARIILETGAGCTRPWVQVKAKQFVQ